MNGCERFMTAIRGGQPDRVPIWELIVNRPVIEALYPDMFDGARSARYEQGSEGVFELLADFVEADDLDAITVFENSRVDREIDDLTFVDEWGLTWRVNEQKVPYCVALPIKTEADLDRWEPPDPDADYRLGDLEAAVERFGGERAIVFLGHDAFEFSHYLRGMENLFMDYALNPALAHRVAEKVIAFKLRVLERAAEAGADVLCGGDDYAANLGPMMSPAHFDEFIAPYLKRCCDVSHGHGLPFLKHTDGYLWPIMDSLLETGIDCLDPIEPVARMDIGEVKERVGHRVSLAGNVDCDHILSRGTPQDVVEAVKETIAKASPGGGHILASSNSIHPGVRPENYRAMLEAAREFGRYPLDEGMVAEYSTKDYMARYR